MNRSHSIDQKKQQAVLRFYGKTEFRDVMEALRDLVEDTYYEDTFDLMVDLSFAVMLYDRQGMERLYRFVCKHSPKVKSKVAIVCFGPIETAVSVVYSTRDSGERSLKVFSSVAAAELWLQKPYTIQASPFIKR